MVTFDTPFLKVFVLLLPLFYTDILNQISLSNIFCQSSVYKHFSHIFLFLYLLSEEVNMQESRAQSPTLPVQVDVENIPA